ncbi:MAG: autotransporter domain-containing protein, partial [Abditibacteriaceae bacterium]
MQTVERNKYSINKMDKKQRAKAGRLIRHALALVAFAAAVVVVPQAANAASVDANGTTITIDSNNNISSGGTLNNGDSVGATNSGSLTLNNSTSTISGVGSSTSGTVTGHGITVNQTYANGVVNANGGGITIDGNSLITGTLADSITLAGEGISAGSGVGIQTVLAQGAGSNIGLDHTTVNTTGYAHHYHSVGIAAQLGGATIHLSDVTVNSSGDKTYGISADGDDGHIIGTNVNITTNGLLSYGVNAYGPNSTIALTGGSITTEGMYSSGVYVNSGAAVTLTNLTVNANDPTSDSIEFKNGTIANPGSVTASGTTLNGNIGVDDPSSHGNVFLTNSSVLNGSVYLPNGNFSVDSSSTFNNTATGDTSFADYTNGHYIFAPPSTSATLTVGNFTANPGSSITMNVFADGGNSSANQVIINTSYSGSQTQIIPVVTGGSGNLPNGGIILVQYNGALPITNANFYSDPVNSGIYTYTGNVSNSRFLLSSQLNSAVVGASVLPALGARTILATLPSVQDRMHAPRLSVTGTGLGDANKGIWARLSGSSDKYRTDGNDGTGFDTSLYAVQAGYDFMAKKDTNGGRSYAGLYLAYGNSSGNAQVNGSNVGSLDLDATSVGAYWTKYTPSDAYLSLTGQYSWLNGIKASGGGESVSPSGSGFALSLEGGKTFHRDASVMIEPQAQLIYQHTNIDNTVLPANGIRPLDTPLSLSSLNSVSGRLGVLFQKNPNSGNNFLPWARLDLWHTFNGDSSLNTGGSDSVESSM